MSDVFKEATKQAKPKASLKTSLTRTHSSEAGSVYSKGAFGGACFVAPLEYTLPASSMERKLSFGA